MFPHLHEPQAILCPTFKPGNFTPSSTRCKSNCCFSSTIERYPVDKTLHDAQHSSRYWFGERGLAALAGMIDGRRKRFILNSRTLASTSISRREDLLPVPSPVGLDRLSCQLLREC